MPVVRSLPAPAEESYSFPPANIGPDNHATRASDAVTSPISTTQVPSVSTETISAEADVPPIVVEPVQVSRSTRKRTAPKWHDDFIMK